MTSPHHRPTATPPRGGGAGPDDPPLRAHGPEALIALVPACLGFHPADSLVVLESAAPGPGGGRLLRAGLRVDLPATPAPDDVAGATGPLLAVLRRDLRPGSRVHLLVHDPDARLRDGALVPGARAAAAVRHVLADLDRHLDAPAGRVEVAEVLLVTADRWRSLSCDLPCCPPAGAPREGGAARRLAAEVVGRGLAPAADRAAALPPTAPFGPGRLTAAAEARRRARREPAGAALVAAFDAAVETRLRSRVPPVPEADWCGRVLAGLADTGVRDAVLLSGAGGPATERARAALLDPGPVPGGTAHLVDRALAAEFDPVRAAAAAAVAVDVARHAVDRSAAGAWAVAAWSLWQAGAGVRAGACTRRALELDPSHRLAGLVEQALRHALRPRR
ncbi:DUF4192 family protein [Kineococcus sp. SYSU DK002]|uniref:DUF4192 family protein n=1 Tax=Kineococcus sp. SYSU DK002 TaxID=3383123 RepID=UPI003D7C5E8B